LNDNPLPLLRHLTPTATQVSSRKCIFRFTPPLMRCHRSRWDDPTNSNSAPYNGPLPNDSTRKYNCHRPHPRSILNSYFLCKESKFGILVVMISRKYIRALTDAAVTPNRHVNVIVNPASLTDPRVIANAKSPWRLY